MRPLGNVGSCGYSDLISPTEHLGESTGPTRGRARASPNPGSHAAAWLGLPLGTAPWLHGTGPPPGAASSATATRRSRRFLPLAPGHTTRLSLPSALRAGLSRPPTSPLPPAPHSGDRATNPSPHAPQQLSPYTRALPKPSRQKDGGRKTYRTTRQKVGSQASWVQLFILKTTKAETKSLLGWKWA